MTRKPTKPRKPYLLAAVLSLIASVTFAAVEIRNTFDTVKANPSYRITAGEETTPLLVVNLTKNGSANFDITNAGWSCTWWFSSNSLSTVGMSISNTAKVGSQFQWRLAASNLAVTGQYFSSFILHGPSNYIEELSRGTLEIQANNGTGVYTGFNWNTTNFILAPDAYAAILNASNALQSQISSNTASSTNSPTITQWQSSNATLAARSNTNGFMTVVNASNTFVESTGNQTLTGNLTVEGYLSMDDNQINNVGSPLASGDAVNLGGMLALSNQLSVASASNRVALTNGPTYGEWQSSNSTISARDSTNGLMTVINASNTFVEASGNQTITGNITLEGFLNMDDNQINSVGTPSLAGDAANKAYVDAATNSARAFTNGLAGTNGASVINATALQVNGISVSTGAVTLAQLAAASNAVNLAKVSINGGTATNLSHVGTFTNAGNVTMTGGLRSVSVDGTNTLRMGSSGGTHVDIEGGSGLIDGNINVILADISGSAFYVRDNAGTPVFSAEDATSIRTWGNRLYFGTLNSNYISIVGNSNVVVVGPGYTNVLGGPGLLQGGGGGGGGALPSFDEVIYYGGNDAIQIGIDMLTNAISFGSNNTVRMEALASSNVVFKGPGFTSLVTRTFTIGSTTIVNDGFVISGGTGVYVHAINGTNFFNVATNYPTDAQFIGSNSWAQARILSNTADIAVLYTNGPTHAQWQASNATLGGVLGTATGAVASLQAATNALISRTMGHLGGVTGDLQQSWVSASNTVGSEIVVNGNFTALGASWVGSGINFASALALCANGLTATLTPSNGTFSIASGKTYRVTFDWLIPEATDTLNFSMGGKTHYASSTPTGQQSFAFVTFAASTSPITFSVFSDNVDSRLDNISVKEITEGDLIVADDAWHGGAVYSVDGYFDGNGNITNYAPARAEFLASNTIAQGSNVLQTALLANHETRLTAVEGQTNTWNLVTNKVGQSSFGAASNAIDSRIDTLEAFDVSAATGFVLQAAFQSSNSTQGIQITGALDRITIIETGMVNQGTFQSSNSNHGIKITNALNRISITETNLAVQNTNHVSVTDWQSTNATAGLIVSNTITRVASNESYISEIRGYTNEAHVAYSWGNHADFGYLTDGTQTVEKLVAANTNFLGSQFISNGTFTGSATGWTLGGFANYVSNKVQVTFAGAGTLLYTQSLSIVSGKVYLVEFYRETSDSGEAIVLSMGGSEVSFQAGLSTGVYAILHAYNTNALMMTVTPTADSVYIDDFKAYPITDGDVWAADQVWASEYRINGSNLAGFFGGGSGSGSGFPLTATTNVGGFGMTNISYIGQTNSSYQFRWPNADGTTGQVFTTDGAGRSYFSTPAAGGGGSSYAGTNFSYIRGSWPTYLNVSQMVFDAGEGWCGEVFWRNKATNYTVTITYPMTVTNMYCYYIKQSALPTFAIYESLSQPIKSTNTFQWVNPTSATDRIVWVTPASGSNGLWNWGTPQTESGLRLYSISHGIARMESGAAASGAWTRPSANLVSRCVPSNCVAVVMHYESTAGNGRIFLTTTDMTNTPSSLTFEAQHSSYHTATASYYETILIRFGLTREVCWASDGGVDCYLGIRKFAIER